MKKIIASLHQMYIVLYWLTKQGISREIGRKIYQYVKAFIEPVNELYFLARDAIVYRTQVFSNGSDDVSTTKLILLPISRNQNYRKNVIWIMLDALRHDVFDEYLKRKGLSELVDEGVYFPRAFAQGSWTYPSVFSFLTGRYPFNCRVSRLMNKDGALVSMCSDFDDSCPTIFTILRQHGYQVASILDGWGFTVRKTAGQGHREDHYFEENWGWIYGQDRRFLSLEELRDMSLFSLRGLVSQGPFMLFVRSLYTHSPYRDIFRNPEYVNHLSRKRWNFRIVEGFIRGLHKFEKLYLNPLIDSLSEAGQLNNTIIILCSDHGDMFWNLENDLREGYVAEEMWRHQLEPYNALIKVPLLIWGTRLQGVYPHRFRLMDILPTLLNELGIEYDGSKFDGISAHSSKARPLYSDSAGYGFGGVAYQLDGPKFLMSSRLGLTSYKISEDDYESVELRRNSVNGLHVLTEFVKQTSRYPDTIVDGEDDGALFRRLEALGYI